VTLLLSGGASEYFRGLFFVIPALGHHLQDVTGFRKVKACVHLALRYRSSRS
jgi:hypothetical protein